MKCALYKPAWNYKDIKNYLGVGTTKAYELMAKCRKHYNGSIKELPSYIKRDSFLAMLGTCVEREIEILKEGGKASSEKTISKRKV